MKYFCEEVKKEIEKLNVSLDEIEKQINLQIVDEPWVSKKTFNKILKGYIPREEIAERISEFFKSDKIYEYFYEDSQGELLNNLIYSLRSYQVSKTGKMDFLKKEIIIETKGNKIFVYWISSDGSGESIKEKYGRKNIRLDYS